MIKIKASMNQYSIMSGGDGDEGGVGSRVSACVAVPGS